MENYNYQQGQYPPPPPFDNNDYYARNNAFDCDAKGKSRGVAALLAILVGGLGIQYFYLGKTAAGIITILLSIITCGIWEIVTLIQGILMFVMNNADFDRKYVYNNSTFPVF